MSQQTAELNACVVQYIEDGKVWDGLSKRTGFTNHCMGKGKKKIDGGIAIQFPIKLIANSAGAWVSGTGAIADINPSVQLQYGTLNWKYYNFNVNFTLQDFTQANGKEQIVDFMATKVEGALNDFIRALSSGLHGSSTTSGTLYPEGLKDIVAASGTSYASLTDTDYSDTYAYLPIIDSSTQVVNYTNINLKINKLKGKLQKELSPDAIMGLMNESVFSRFQSSVQNQQLFTETSLLKAGSEGFKVNGIDFIMDADCPGTQDGSTADNYCYIFPTDIMKLYYRFGFGTKSPFDGEVRMPNQPIMSTQHWMAFNLVCLNRRLVMVFKTLVG